MMTDAKPTIDIPVAPSKKSRCPCCNKKLGLISFSCRCGGTFCTEHRLDVAHNCSFDYQAEQQKFLSSALEKVTGEKLSKI
jgi:predicted nucleic acid binding AN1-type Zn finger protein